MNPVVALNSLCLVGKPAKTQATEWQVEKLGLSFSWACDNILCLCALVQGSVFIVSENKIATCSALHNWVSLVNINYLVEFC